MRTKSTGLPNIPDVCAQEFTDKYGSIESVVKDKIRKRVDAMRVCQENILRGAADFELANVKYQRAIDLHQQSVDYITRCGGGEKFLYEERLAFGHVTDIFIQTQQGWAGAFANLDKQYDEMAQEKVDLETLLKTLDMAGTKTNEATND